MILAIMSGVAILLAFLGWGVHKKKWYFLISGYNTMSKEQQSRVDVEGLAKSLSIMLYIVAILLVALGFILNNENWNVVSIGAPILTVLLIVIPLIFTFFARKYYPKDMSMFAGSTSPKGKKWSIIITVVTLVVVGIIIYSSAQPTKIEITDTHLAISGMYGDDIKWEEISDLVIQETMPKIKMRTNGSSIGSKAIGNFTLEGGEKVKLFIDKSVNQYIFFKWKDKQYILNHPTKAETVELYHKMQNNMKK